MHVRSFYLLLLLSSLLFLAATASAQGNPCNVISQGRKAA